MKETVGTFLVVEEVVFAVKPTLVAFARADWAEKCLGFGAVHLSLVTLEAGFLSERLVCARILAADVWAGVLFLVSSMML
jgi:hypothetical protein